MTGTRNTKTRENLLREKKLTLEKALDIAHGAESTAAQMKVMSSESGLFAVKEQEKGQPVGVPDVSEGRMRAVDFEVGATRDATVMHLDRCVAIVKRRITL